VLKKNLVLLGMMTVGKTTLGRIVAKRQGIEFADIDENIEKKNSMTIGDIFKKKGEKFFRIEEEKESLKFLKKNNCVIALGGGSFMNKNIRESVLKNSISIWLDNNIKVLEKRAKWTNKRPLLKNENKLKKLDNLYNQRKAVYKLANYKITCDKLSKENIIDKIISLYEKN
jgi:shikimate kinase